MQVCRALLPTMHALRGATTGASSQEAQDKLVNACDLAVGMTLAVLDVHKDEMAVRSEALLVLLISCSLSVDLSLALSRSRARAVSPLPLPPSSFPSPSVGRAGACSLFTCR